MLHTMALTDIFKKKKKKREIQAKVSPREFSEKKLQSSFRLPMILKAAHVTEKAGDLAGKNQYIFKIYPEANKIKIKQEVENVFNVNVTSIRTINIPKRKKKLGKIIGWQKGYKKAIIGIKKGQKIDILPR